VGQFEGAGRRIVAALKERIHSGACQPGDRLPSSRAFAAEWGASRTMVTAAYGQLIAEGYLVTRAGAGRSWHLAWRRGSAGAAPGSGGPCPLRLCTTPA
jgi:DNA-binding transcriptional MocR family regulator